MGTELGPILFTGRGADLKRIASGTTIGQVKSKKGWNSPYFAPAVAAYRARYKKS
jgi:hypothetical protein